MLLQLASRLSFFCLVKWFPSLPTLLVKTSILPLVNMPVILCQTEIPGFREHLPWQHSVRQITVCGERFNLKRQIGLFSKCLVGNWKPLTTILVSLVNRRAALGRYHSCGDNHGIKPPNPEQYLTPLQQKEVAIRHLKTKLLESENRVHDRLVKI